jgi:hypothetical protein
MAYHYPQQTPNGAPSPRQGLSSLEPASQQGPDFGYGQQRGFAAPGTDPRAHNPGYPPAGAPYGGQGGYDQWQGSQAQEPRGPNYDLGGYMPAGAQRPGGPIDPLQQQPEWVHPAHAGYGDPSIEGGYQAGYEQQPHHTALEQSYAEEHAEYESEEPRRGSWALRIAGAIVVAIGMGYGLAQGYKLVASSSDVATPVVKGDAEPARTEPTDPGGKQFAHTDSKIMDRLEDGQSSSSTPPATPAVAEATDENGTRKVPTLVVGRDGSITPPAAPSEPATTGSVGMPGVTMVDGYGGRFPSEPASPPAPPAAEQAPTFPPGAAQKPIVVKPPATAAESKPVESKPVTLAKVEPVETPATSTPEAATAPETPAPAAPAKKAPAPTTTAAIPSTGAEPTGGGGYVVVLASVPASGDSRLVALKRFADMQQKYGSVLQNKTPDVREANLGEKGVYHRLLVGPPSSRSQASQLCVDLKTAGYKDCWVTAY